MAYSSVRVQFEIGHEASVRTKKTPEGFTHDWEVFVRGADNTDIKWFVDKVVFHLHETFPKPRRVIKEPPYVVKESGYAGFVLPIDVYLKNKEEPKKISFQYDLTLQSSGPPISRVLREPRLFQNPSEDFRRKLIRGGGVGVDTPAEAPADDLKSAPSLVSQNKAKPADSPAKKLKPDQPLNHSFAELFGTPIRRVPEPKKLPEPSKKVDDKKKVSKPYKEEKEVSREKYSERDKSKEKTKRPPSPLLPPPASAKSKDDHKKHEEKEKKREEHEEKKKKREEKEKDREKDKEKREKTKEPERQLEKEHKREKKEGRNGDYAKKPNIKPSDPKTNYEKHNSEGVEKEKERLEKEKHKHRHKKKEKEKNREKDKHRKEREKDLREIEKEREKSMKKKQEEMREKEERRRKSRSPSPVHFKKGPLNALLDELGSSDSASPLSEDDSIPSAVKPIPKLPAKPVPDLKLQPVVNVATKLKSTNPNEAAPASAAPPPPPPKLDEDSINRSRKEKSSSKKSKKQDKDPEKRREKEELRARSISSERAEKDDEKEEEEEKDRTNKEDRQEKDKPDEDKPKPKDKENRKRKREKSEEKQTKTKKNTPRVPPISVEGVDGDAEESRRADKFTKEYVAQLKDLQHRIMTLEDNAELQKVVKVIAETGQYEVTKKTFDFDLCALDMDTVKRLQEFFAPT